MAAGFYKFIKILEYENANPGQDDERMPMAYADGGKEMDLKRRGEPSWDGQIYEMSAAIVARDHVGVGRV